MHEDHDGTAAIETEMPLADQLASIEEEVRSSRGPRLLELAAREYEILEQITRPWRGRVARPVAPAEE